MFPLLVGINLDDLPIGDANDTKSAPIVNKNIRFVREGWKKETLASSHFPRDTYAVYVEGNNAVTLRKTANPDRMCTRNV